MLGRMLVSLMVAVLMTACSPAGGGGSTGASTARKAPPAPAALPEPTSPDDAADAMIKVIKIAAEQARGVPDADRNPRIEQTYESVCSGIRVAVTVCPAPDGGVTIYINPYEAGQKYLMRGSAGGSAGVQDSALNAYAKYLGHRVVQRRPDLQGISDLGDARMPEVAKVFSCVGGQVYGGLSGLMPPALRDGWLPASSDPHRTDFDKGVAGKGC